MISTHLTSQRDRKVLIIIIIILLLLLLPYPFILFFSVHKKSRIAVWYMWYDGGGVWYRNIITWKKILKIIVNRDFITFLVSSFFVVYRVIHFPFVVWFCLIFLSCYISWVRATYTQADDIYFEIPFKFFFFIQCYYTTWHRNKGNFFFI